MFFNLYSYFNQRWQKVLDLYNIMILKTKMNFNVRILQMLLSNISIFHNLVISFLLGKLETRRICKFQNIWKIYHIFFPPQTLKIYIQTKDGQNFNLLYAVNVWKCLEYISLFLKLKWTHSCNFACFNFVILHMINWS